MSKRNSTAPRAVKGILLNHLEPATGEIVWAFRKEARKGYGYGVPRPLEKGDYLIVFNDSARKNEIWSGDIDLEFKSNQGPKPGCPHVTAQCVKGVGPVHGVQKGVDAEEWGKMFVDGKPAILIAKRQISSPPKHA